MMPLIILFLVVGVVLLSAKTATAYVGGKPVQIELGDIGSGLYLRKDAADAFNRMKNAASADGISLTTTGARSAFRTPDQQASLEESGLAAPVNYSAHQMGIAVDLTTANEGEGPGTNDAFMWLTANAATYRFFPLPLHPEKEPWHWEFHP